MNPVEISMAMFEQAFEKDTTFIFGSWVCTADGAGGWNRCLKPDEKKEKGTSSVDDLIESLDEIQMADMVKGHEYESKTLKTQAQPPTTLFEVDRPTR